MSTGRLTAGRWLVAMGALTLVGAGTVVLAASVGIEPLHLARALAAGTRDHVILFQVRLPRIVLGLLVGAALGASGATLQAILRNPLADPYILGVSGGAALGGTLALSAGAALAAVARSGSALAGVARWALGPGGHLGTVPVTLAACAGALLAVGLTVAVARGAGGLHPHSLLLSGVVFNAFAAAVILFLRTVVTEEKAQELLYWLMGTLGYRPWHDLAVMAALVALGTALLVAWSGRLNLLAVGDAGAHVLGIDVDRTRLLLVIASSLVVGVAVSLAGLVGFVGLMVPHILRLLLGPDHRLLVPASALGGAAFLVASDLVARLLFRALGTEPPVGVVTAFLGGPFFLWLMSRRPVAGGGGAV